MSTPTGPAPGQGPGQGYAQDPATYPQPAPAAGDPALAAPQEYAAQEYAQPPAGYQGAPQGRSGPQGPTRSRPRQAAELARQLRTPETKEFFKTSEFALTILGVLILIIAAAAQDNFDSPQLWRLFTAILVAYIISRGIAKAGSNRSDPDSR